MKDMIFAIVGLLIGIVIAIAGGMYLKKEWTDKESRRIYGVFLGLGVVIVIGVVIKISVVGF